MRTNTAPQTRSHQIIQRSQTMPYQLYGSVTEMLAPKTLCTIIGRPVRKIRLSPLDKGLSGARLSAVEVTHTTASQNYILKQMSSQWDWAMLSSKDRVCRSVALWRHGLLDCLQPTVEHTILAGAYDNDGWALLMKDVNEKLIFPNEEFEPFNVAKIKSLLDGLAAIHAQFWQAPELANPIYNLCNNAEMLATLSLPIAQEIPSESSPVPEWIIEGWPLLLDMVEPDVAATLQALLANPQPLITALDSFPLTLVHGDFRAMNLGLGQPEKLPLIALDWQLASHSVATVDLAWFIIDPEKDLPSFSIDTAVAYYRQSLERRLGYSLSEALWQPMWELGMLVNVLRSGSFLARWSVHAETENDRAYCRKIIEWYNEQVKVAAKWL